MVKGFKKTSSITLHLEVIDIFLINFLLNNSFIHIVLAYMLLISIWNAQMDDIDIKVDLEQKRVDDEIINEHDSANNLEIFIQNNKIEHLT